MQRCARLLARRVQQRQMPPRLPLVPVCLLHYAKANCRSCNTAGTKCGKAQSKSGQASLYSLNLIAVQLAAKSGDSFQFPANAAVAVTAEVLLLLLPPLLCAAFIFFFFFLFQKRPRHLIEATAVAATAMMQDSKPATTASAAAATSACFLTACLLIKANEDASARVKPDAHDSSELRHRLRAISTQVAASI